MPRPVAAYAGTSAVAVAPIPAVSSRYSCRLPPASALFLPRNLRRAWAATAPLAAATAATVSTADSDDFSVLLGPKLTPGGTKPGIA
ncbi:Uncharacterised protein [Mycobacteroides abscessus subsp. abscessus]|nr:Uncharacterised protein [Mycobacteroides abscessus subsp. abscessus]